MTTTTTAGAPAPTASANALTANQLPTWATPVGAGVAALVGLGLAFAATGGFNPGLAVALALVVFLATLHVASLVIEGARKATDRFFKHLVYVAFGLALLPLISLLWTVLAQGLRRFDVTFFTWSMRNVVGEGGGATHAITGTLFVTGIAALISVPIGLLTAVYLAEYGEKAPLARGITFFVDVMTGIPSIVAGLFAYAVFALLSVLAWRLHQQGRLARQRRWIVGLAALQLVTGLSNVVLDWPLVAAVLHTGGAAALMTVLTWALCASRAASQFDSKTIAARAIPTSAGGLKT